MKEALIGLGSAIIGFISGLLVPWVRWEIEKRRKRYARRAELVETWRRRVQGSEFYTPEGRESFGESSEYSSLRAKMDPKVAKAVDEPRTFYVGGGRGDDVRKQMLLDEIARIEKKWGLR